MLIRRKAILLVGARKGAVEPVLDMGVAEQGSGMEEAAGAGIFWHGEPVV